MRASRTSLPILLIASLIGAVITLGPSNNELPDAGEWLSEPPYSSGPNDSISTTDDEGPPDASVPPNSRPMESAPASRPTDGPVADIQRGSPDRSAILDALRPTAEREYGAPVEFIVLELRRSRSVAFASVQPQRPGGGTIDCGSANCAPTGHIDAILQPDAGTWRLVDARVRANDEWRMGYCPQMPVGLIRECD